MSYTVSKSLDEAFQQMEEKQVTWCADVIGGYGVCLLVAKNGMRTILTWDFDTARAIGEALIKRSRHTTEDAIYNQGFPQ